MDALCRPLSDVVDAMGLETGLVIQNLKQASAASSTETGREGLLAQAPHVVLSATPVLTISPHSPTHTTRLQAQSSGGGGRSGRTPSPRGGSGPPAAMDPDVLLRILCHRADHAASKLLKKDYKARRVVSIRGPLEGGWAAVPTPCCLLRVRAVGWIQPSVPGSLACVG